VNGVVIVVHCIIYDSANIQIAGYTLHIILERERNKRRRVRRESVDFESCKF